VKRDYPCPLAIVAIFQNGAKIFVMNALSV